MQRDNEVFDLINKEKHRQETGIELIASENFASPQVMEAMGSVLTNKYAEGLPGKRYYGGCEVVDEIENLAIKRVKKLFGANWANVQPHSGSQANTAVFAAIIFVGGIGWYQITEEGQKLNNKNTKDGQDLRDRIAALEKVVNGSWKFNYEIIYTM